MQTIEKISRIALFVYIYYAKYSFPNVGHLSHAKVANPHWE